MMLIKKNITTEAKQAINSILKEHGEKASFEYLRGPSQDEKERNDEGGKIKVGKSLISEQGYLCAYCMQRINSAEKIEHWISQKVLKDNPNETLNYNILLAVCSGVSERSGIVHHCDTKRGNIKGDDTLTLNPTNANLMQFIKYGRNGQMYFECNDLDLNKQINDDIIKRLALDIDTEKNDYASQYALRTNRKLEYEAVERVRKSYKARFKNDFPKKLEAYIKESWEEKDKDGKLRPYCRIVLYFKKQLMRPYF
jgi:uncharacterized protein (TIGR02646 family)